jgi:multimeric flavodoxin WrbA
MKITILNGSHRIDGNSYRFSRYAQSILEKKHQVTIFDLVVMDIKPCNGCLVCEDGESCPLIDDYSSEIMPALQSAELIIFVSPTYFNMPSAAMVNLLDRTNNLCTYFSETPKKALICLFGQTDEETIGDAYKCLHAYCEIMKMPEIAQAIIKVAREPSSDWSMYSDVLMEI